MHWTLIGKVKTLYGMKYVAHFCLYQGARLFHFKYFHYILVVSVHYYFPLKFSTVVITPYISIHILAFQFLSVYISLFHLNFVILSMRSVKRKPGFCLADHRLYNSIIPLLQVVYIQNFKFTAFFCDYLSLFVSQLVGNFRPVFWHRVSIVFGHTDFYL